MNDGKSISAMAFYHPHGLVPAWKQAAMFAGEGGRIATLPDVIDARIATTPRRSAAWKNYFTTATAEFYGVGPSGSMVLAVAHGVGPLSTVEGCLKAYAKGHDGRRGQGRIPRATFLRLLAGDFGEVHTVDWPAYVAARGKNMIHALTADEAAADAWTVARLGGQERAREYLSLHAGIAREHIAEHEPRVPPAAGDLAVFENKYGQGAPYVSYEFAGKDMIPSPAVPEDAGGFASAHLVSLGQLFNTSRWGSPWTVLSCEASPHDWTDGTRFVGVRAGQCTAIHPGVDMDRVIGSGDPRLWIACSEKAGFDLVLDVDGKNFTAYPKVGDGMDTGEPMLAVTSIEKVGGMACFETKPSGYYGFFRYALSEIRGLAPATANAYEIVGNPWIEGRVQKANVQFLKIEADRSRRLMRRDDLYRNDALMLELAAEQA